MPALRHTPTLPLALTLALAGLTSGCLEWSVAPEEAVGLLAVDGASISGQVGDVVLDATPTTRDVGYCIVGGYEVELTAEAGGRTVMLTLTVMDYFPATVDTLTVSRDPSDPDYLLGDGGEKVALAGCEGPADGVWDTEKEADGVVLDVQRTSDIEQHVVYTATFADGQQVEAQFDMRTPTVD
jgi:hypothetical protein